MRRIDHLVNCLKEGQHDYPDAADHEQGHDRIDDGDQGGDSLLRFFGEMFGHAVKSFGQFAGLLTHVDQDAGDGRKQAAILQGLAESGSTGGHAAPHILKSGGERPIADELSASIDNLRGRLVRLVERPINCAKKSDSQIPIDGSYQRQA